MNQDYVDTVQLLLDVAPAVFASGRFAMKGGTALNLFVQDMPRLSVDIDVVFVDPAPDRDAALAFIGAELRALRRVLEARGLQVHLPANAQGDEVRMLVSNDLARVRIEVNFVFRGTVLPVQARELTTLARRLFTTAVRLPLLAPAELYGSKLVAAMDRQHPRDLFDVTHMLERFGWHADIIDCFVAYLAGHNRPIHEVLFAPVKALEPAFTNEFVGMTRDEPRLDALVAVQTTLLEQLPRQLGAHHRDFLLSMVRAEPRWELMPFDRLDELPAIKWKLQNLQSLKRRNARKFEAQYRMLADAFANG